MIEITNEQLIYLSGFSLLLVRMLSLVYFLPFFGDTYSPLRTKIFLGVSLAVLMAPTLDLQSTGTGFSQSLMSFMFAVSKEAIFGVFIGYIAKTMIDVVVMAASFLGYQMGFGMANLIMPGSTDQMNAFTVLNKMIFMLIFFTLDLHHIFIHGIGQSLIAVPLGELSPQSGLYDLLITVTSSIFSVSLTVAAPVLVALLFTMAALGLIARVVPQMNVFTLSFPISFFVGLLVYAATLVAMPTWTENYAESIGTAIDETLLLLSNPI